MENGIFRIKEGNFGNHFFQNGSPRRAALSSSKNVSKTSHSDGERRGGQALFEFCLILAILIPLCVVGFYHIGLLGDKKMEKEKQRFNNDEKPKISYRDIAATFSSIGFEQPFSLINDTEGLPLRLLPFADEKAVSFKSEKHIVHLAETEGHGADVISHYRKQFQEQNWAEQEEYGIWIFSKENQRAFLWATDQQVAVIFY